MATTEWYIGGRAEALAKIILTRHSNLTLLDQASALGTDLLVSINRGSEHQTGRIFGVKVLSAIQARKRVLADGSILLPGVEEPDVEPLRDLPLPVCCFFFTMEDDAGYFRWLKKPVASETEPMRLATVHDTSFVELTNKIVSEALKQVNAWYDARLAMK